MVKGTARTSFNTETGAKQLVLSYPVSSDLYMSVAASDSTFKNSLGEYTDIKIGIERPKEFSIFWDAAKKAPTVAFASHGHAFGQKIGLLYSHDQKSEKAILAGSVSLNSQHSLTGKYNFRAQTWEGFHQWKLDGANTLDTGYKFDKKTGSLGWTHKLSASDTVRIGYDLGDKEANLLWRSTRSGQGALLVAATIPTNKESNKPYKAVITKEWAFEIDPPREWFKIRP